MGKDIKPDALLIQICRRGLDAYKIFSLPAFQPLSQRQFAGFNIGSPVDLGGNLPELLGNFLLCLSCYGTLLLLPCNGVIRYGKTRFPVCIVFALLGNGDFANTASAGR